jgi:hypothetical protein
MTQPNKLLPIAKFEVFQAYCPIVTPVTYPIIQWVEPAAKSHQLEGGRSEHSLHFVLSGDNGTRAS